MRQEAELVPSDKSPMQDPRIGLVISNYIIRGDDTLTDMEQTGGYVAPEDIGAELLP